jgi:hypothetical protein
VSDLFVSVERPALRALPASDYEFAEWRLARVGLDYHVEIDGFYYSVPHALIHAQVDVRITSRIIEVFHHGKRVAAHQRRYGGPRHGTRSGPHAERASALRRMVAGALRTVGAHDRSEHRRPRHRRARQPSASRGLNPARAEAIAARALAIGALTYSLHSQKQSRSRSTGR